MALQIVKSSERFQLMIDNGDTLADIVVYGVDFRRTGIDFKGLNLSGSLFMGCYVPKRLLPRLIRKGVTLYPTLEGLPFNPFRTSLYTRDTLFPNYDPQSPCSYCDTADGQIYRYWVDAGRAHPLCISDAMAQRLHDVSITQAISTFLDGKDPLKRVAIMGGHNLSRDSKNYRKVVDISAALARDGYLLISGGGPGAMEATHLGVLMADRTDSEIDHAIAHLAKAPTYKDENWLSTAFDILDRYKTDEPICDSLAIPTWLYGHEPPTPFASHIAKYFSNSLREEGLITLAVGGIIFAPGNAGTIQEIFQDAAQNRYATTGIISPMIFLDKTYWTKDKPVYPLLQTMARGKTYADHLGIADDVTDILSLLRSKPPLPSQDTPFSYCGHYCGL